MTEHILVTIGKQYFQEPKRDAVRFLDDNAQNELLNDIENTPHAYVLACLMDRQVRAERAWSIPYIIKEDIGSFDIDKLATISLENYKALFHQLSLHRFNDTMAEVFFHAVQDIQTKYSGNVSLIWDKHPSSAKVVYEFLQFRGCGVKIANMAANILARDFKIPFSDYYSIDISPDIHAMRVLKRAGLVDNTQDVYSVIYKAREMHPEFPGIIDVACWEIGRKWCKSSSPDCENCEIQSECRKVIK